MITDTISISFLMGEVSKFCAPPVHPLLWAHPEQCVATTYVGLLRKWWLLKLMAPQMYGSPKCMAPLNVWLPQMYGSPKCMAPQNVWLPQTVYFSPKYMTPTIVWLPNVTLPNICRSPYTMTSHNT